ncbi:MAG: hypothetical protein ABDH59_03870 [Fervidobacterium sp.]
MRNKKNFVLTLLFVSTILHKKSIIFVHGRGGQCGNDYTQDAGNYWGNSKNIATSLQDILCTMMDILIPEHGEIVEPNQSYIKC